MNPAAILGLLSDLYTQIGTLQAENNRLREALQAAAQPADDGTEPVT